MPKIKVGSRFSTSFYGSRSIGLVAFTKMVMTFYCFYNILRCSVRTLRYTVYIDFCSIVLELRKIPLRLIFSYIREGIKGDAGGGKLGGNFL